MPLIKKGEFLLAGRCVLVFTGTRTQTVNVYAGLDEKSKKQVVIRLRQPLFTSAEQLESRGFEDADELKAYLIAEHDGELEQPRGRTFGRLLERLAVIAGDLGRGEPALGPTVRELLSWAGAQRRGPYVVQGIRQSLEDNGLDTDPDFEVTYIDSPVSFVRVPEVVEVEVADAPLATADNATPDRQWADPAFLVSRLKAFDGDVSYVAPTDSLELATTRLLADVADEIPVMTGRRSAKGVISWESIGRRLALGRTHGTVSDFMDPHVEVDMDDELSMLVERVSRHGFVLVRSRHRNNEIVGSMTSRDLARHLEMVGRPFRVIGEIERWLRLLVIPHIGRDAALAIDPEDTGIAARSSANLSLGECQRWLEVDENWTKVSIPLDKTEFIKLLAKVRAIRNSVMHFNADAIDSDLEELSDFSRLLQTVLQKGRL